jgi:uncharacterized protein
MLPPAAIFLLPGWLDSGPTHWQSRWEAAHAHTRVQQHDWQRPLRGDWVARLEEVIVNHIAAPTTHAHSLSKKELVAHYSISPEADLITNNHTTASSATAVPSHAQRSIILVAHSLGCHLVAAWAAASRHTAAVRGALLVAAPDLAQEDLPPDLYSWRKPVLSPLPFPATCVVSANDPFGSLAAGQRMAAAWGARCELAGPLGHINGDSGLGDWPEGYALLNELLQAKPVAPLTLSSEHKKDAPHGH